MLTLAETIRPVFLCLNGSDRTPTRSYGYTTLCLHRIYFRLPVQRGRRLLVVFMEESLLEKEDRYHTDGNGSIRQVKYRTEELEFITTHHGEPGRVMGLHQWEVEHVHYAAMKKGGISMMRKDLCDMIEGALFEDQTVEHAIQQVTQRTGEDQSCADDKPPVIFLLDDLLYIIDAEHHGHQAEQGQGHLAPGTAELPAPGHPFIFHEIDLSFITQELDTIVIRRHLLTIDLGRMAQRHMRLYPDLQRLIRHDDQ